VLDCLLNRQ